MTSAQIERFVESYKRLTAVELNPFMVLKAMEEMNSCLIGTAQVTAIGSASEQLRDALGIGRSNRDDKPWTVAPMVTSYSAPFPR